MADAVFLNILKVDIVVLSFFRSDAMWDLKKKWLNKTSIPIKNIYFDIVKVIIYSRRTEIFAPKNYNKICTWILKSIKSEDYV